MFDIFLPTFGPSFPGLPIGPLTPGSPCLEKESIMDLCSIAQACTQNIHEGALKA